MSAASELLAKIIASGVTPPPEQATVVMPPPIDPLHFERGCQAVVERDFIAQVARHVDAEYADVEVALDSMGVNVAGLVNSPTGRAVLAHSLVSAGTPVLRSQVQ